MTQQSFELQNPEQLKQIAQAARPKDDKKKKKSEPSFTTLAKLEQ